MGFNFLRVVHLYEDYSAVMNSGSHEWNVVGTYKLNRLMQHESSHEAFVLIRFNEVTKRLEVERKYWPECPNYSLPTRMAGTNLISLQDELFLHAPFRASKSGYV